MGGFCRSLRAFFRIWVALRSFGAQIRYMAVPSGPWLALVALRAPVLSLCAPPSLVSSTLVQSACPPLSYVLGAREGERGSKPATAAAAEIAEIAFSARFVLNSAYLQ